ncbi:MAG: ATP synthase F1 subunit gamma [Patescibacteria group bacterium]
MSLKQVKLKIRAVKKTEQVTKAMEAVSAAKMRKAQEWALSARPYAYSAFKILKRIISQKEPIRHKLIEDRNGTEAKKALFIVLTSDRGLAGSLNSSILRLLANHLKENNYEKGNVSFITIGRKASEFVSRRNYLNLFSQKSFDDKTSLSEVIHIREIAEKTFRNGDFHKVYIVYTNFISTFEQRAIFHQLFPLKITEIESVLDGVRPTKGKYSNLFNKESSEKQTIYNYEPGVKSVLDSLLPFLAETIIFYAAIEFKASEHSARMVAMKSAGDKAKEVIKDLTRDYNKERQSIITREMSEIVGGIEALQVKNN